MPEPAKPENGPEEKPSFEDYLAQASEFERSPEFLNVVSAIIAPEPEPSPAAPKEEPPPAPVVEKPLEAPPPAPEPEKPPVTEPQKEPEKPPPPPTSTPGDEEDHTKVFAEFEGDPARMAAAIAAERRERKAAPAAPAAAEPPKPATEQPPTPAKEPEAKDVDHEAYLIAISKKPANAREPHETVFMRAVGAIGERRKTFEDAVTAYNETKTGLGTLRTQLGEARTVLKHLETKKEKNPDDFNVGEELETQRAEVRRLTIDEDAQALRERRQRLEMEDVRTDYVARRGELLEAIDTVHARDAAAVAADAQLKADEEANTKAWREAFPRVVEKIGLGHLTPQAQERVNEFLLIRANAELTVRHNADKGDFENIETWMESQGPALKDLADAIRGESVKTYTEKKLRDARPAAPSGAAASAPAKEPASSRKPMDWDEANRAADEVWKRERGIP